MDRNKKGRRKQVNERIEIKVFDLKKILKK